ncbi:MAG: hypothetical protein HC905_02465 [Bacteroidales bacterium]|nr:hypothetical protein [Bacteroidales bacterium]
MKHFLLVLVVLLNSFFLNSQFARVNHVHAVKATVLGLSYSYERSIGNESVINIECMVAGRFGSNIFLSDYWVIAPVLRVEPRYYYNYLRRKEYGKKNIE